MSTLAPSGPSLAQGQRTFAIVASRFNESYVQGMIEHATDEFRALAPEAIITLHRVPGAFEIPIVVRELALQKKADAILALGVILKGQTDHAEHLARAVTDALQRIALEHGVPVTNAVLSLENEEQARERCLGAEINRGTEAARAAHGIVSTLAELRAR
ncbi:MAG TPA: 6,7-dimethyl-8-ribityllumazine synthase [Chthoniobacterales bacterium]|nr:6,7-dimethyl-8-ribityllumazine synthase [Chthoniobacterales bacterium]